MFDTSVRLQEEASGCFRDQSLSTSRDTADTLWPRVFASPITLPPMSYEHLNGLYAGVFRHGKTTDRVAVEIMRF